ncbi:hypothetical protein KCP70_01385 [Salmonella enterica subsp. enterica]|nr:hypothetical protein KCP70_01385 [Salmonella enterica subsp. enterica]
MEESLRSFRWPAGCGFRDGVPTIITPQPAVDYRLDATKSGARWERLGVFLDRFTGAGGADRDVSRRGICPGQVTRTLGEMMQSLPSSITRRNPMKRLMFIGLTKWKTADPKPARRSAHYKKTRLLKWSPMAIDTPGEYLENSAACGSARDQRLRSRRYRALVLNADAQWSPFSPGVYRPMNRPTISLPVTADPSPTPRFLPLLLRNLLTQASRPADFITALNNSAPTPCWISNSANPYVLQNNGH